MQANLKVRRFDPADEGGKTWWQEYKVDVHPDSTVLDSLIHIREQEDGTLALRCACRASICGSCGMKVNGDAKLVCKTRVDDIAPNGEQLVIEPMGNQHVVRDLVVSLDTFFSQIKRVDPFLQPSHVPVQLELISFELQNALRGVEDLLGIKTADEILDNMFNSFCVGK